jgi:IS30 family transposase
MEKFAKHRKIVKALQIYLYFCKSYRFGKRESNENTYELIRQHIPKVTDFGEITDEFFSNLRSYI